MPKPNPHEVTRLHLAWSEGDKAAMDHLMPLGYGELRRLAKSHMRWERAGHTLQTTALIHEELLAPDEALLALAVFDARKSQVVELRFFGGLSVEETAEALDVSVETVRHDWRLARSWLLRRLRGGRPDEA